MSNATAPPADSPVAASGGDGAVPPTRNLRIPKPSKHLASKVLKISFTDAYGYRGRDAALYYLSPWEFTKWWMYEPLHDPNWYHKKQRNPLTEWTSAEAAKENRQPSTKHAQRCQLRLQAHMQSAWIGTGIQEGVWRYPRGEDAGSGLSRRVWPST